MSPHDCRTQVTPVGMTEIAECLGVKFTTVQRWVQRGIFLPRRWTTGGRPAWDWNDVVDWANSVTPQRTIVKHPNQKAN